LKKSKENFFEKVYKVVALIPYGKVTTYGHIAEVCGIKSAARTVGWAINNPPSELNLPCHRVVNRFGALTGRMHFGDPFLMESLLREEGIEFDENNCVILKKHLWIPAENKGVRKHKNTGKN